jgi:ATP-dependent DNA helicase RecQ
VRNRERLVTMNQWGRELPPSGKIVMTQPPQAASSPSMAGRAPLAARIVHRAAFAALHYRSPMGELDDTLQHQFGLEAFRPWQREAIEALLDGPRRVLVVAPTGGGKSLCYQLPAATLDGTSVVVSPLIALMDDQVRSLHERGIPATYLASTLEFEELRERERELARGRYKLVYVAPERLRSGHTRALLVRLAPPLVAIDEAHCISQWGHDFRPDYLRIGDMLAALKPERVLACTATATPTVRDEILERLAMPPASTAVVLRGFARPNLHLEVEELEKPSQRQRVALARLRAALGTPDDPLGAAIVYAGTRRASERVAKQVAELGWRSAAYHAGLEPEVREQVGGAFASGELDVVVATNAFGMGIDRPDIRLVLHTQAPGSIEAYYQEVGRAGRDGQPAFGVLLSGSSDYGFWRRLIESPRGDDVPDPERVERAWRMFLDLMRYVEAGSCDVCERLEAQDEAGDEDREAANLVVRKALAGVARMRRRAGLTALAASLHGDDTQRMRQLGLDQLSTHGVLSEHGGDWIIALLRRLLTAGLIDLTPSDRPVPYLTPAGRDVMMQQAESRVLLPALRTKKTRGAAGRRRRGATASVHAGEADPELYEALRDVRSMAAKEKGVPAYVVCHDRTLLEIAALRPRSLDVLAMVHGMGPARLDAYGDRFLEAVKSFAAEG